MEKKCDKCCEQTKVKYLKKIRGVLYCKNCAKELRLNRRKETIELSGIEEELKILNRKIKRDYQRKFVERNKTNESPEEYFPKIKVSNKKEKVNGYYISTQEKRLLFSMLIKRGMSYEDAGQRMKELIESQSKLTEELRNKNKPEKEIKLKMRKLLEELWNY